MEKLLTPAESSAALSITDVACLLKYPVHISLQHMIQCTELNQFLQSDPDFEQDFLKLVESTLERAFVAKDDQAAYEIHSSLYQLYNLQISDPLSSEALNQHQPFFYALRNTIEEYWLNHLNLDSIYQLDHSAGDISDTIMQLCESKNLSAHPLFDFLAHEATDRQLYAFFHSDYELNIRFFDLLILTLLNSPATARMEMIKNLWDESGKGDRKETHVNMFNDLMEHFNLDNKASFPAHDSWQKMAGYNLFMLASLNRKHYYLLLGIMAATEIIDPQSYLKVQVACQRHGLTEWLYRYYSEHSEIDIEHSQGWLNYVIAPILKERDVNRDILLGVVYRLKTCQEYYDSLLKYVKSVG
ncbi:iron-containing redox enzyme family protein [uncultured Acinetobacter sp.]|uniref:iron-containing redox enzyme family protein n=1 Tax=uncultured Acinetobacter sp. TaxID=165433 RepID=UPI00258F3DAC|nr:iron-containing redox enzyme family protein [uncultured Acinetobacter sp.]